MGQCRDQLSRLRLSFAHKNTRISGYIFSGGFYGVGLSGDTWFENVKSHIIGIDGGLETNGKGNIDKAMAHGEPRNQRNIKIGDRIQQQSVYGGAITASFKSTRNQSSRFL
jgi:hypothetical protein